ncbi:hypothetical protein [Bradyrhizobium sp. Leo121]|uniref:hypothetical protein n=1 Tax=Bradyrhizobium sp. Leo121 TaxID=1571195 RepID=UPI0010296E94|nr:hypothetical protein [Bradyrhizobium sp. Leo121]
MKIKPFSRLLGRIKRRDLIKCLDAKFTLRKNCSKPAFFRNAINRAEIVAPYLEVNVAVLRTPDLLFLWFFEHTETLARVAKKSPWVGRHVVPKKPLPTTKTRTRALR